jgi:hypothetical protein
MLRLCSLCHQGPLDCWTAICQWTRSAIPEDFDLQESPDSLDLNFLNGKRLTI